MPTVQLYPEDDVFLAEGYLNASYQLFLGAKSVTLGIAPPPFAQTMYDQDGNMPEPWQWFFQQNQLDLGKAQALIEQPFADENNKITTPWLDWLQTW